MKISAKSKAKNLNISWLIYLATGAIIVLIIRLFYLQFVLSNQLLKMSENNFARKLDIKPSRGMIFDCCGRALASNQAITDLIWQGSGNNQLTEAQKNMLQEIENITPLINKNYIPFYEKYTKNIPIAKNLPKKTLFKILEKFSGHPNLALENNAARYYPNGSIACHIVGYLGLADNSGRMGLEKLCEPLLAGAQGQSEMIINAFGAQINKQQLRPAQEGENVRTTLDLGLQQIAEEIFPPDISGALLLMDPENGDLKAVISRPAFDPNLFLEPMTTRQWQEISSTGPFINRAFNALYPPASLFKLITVAAALEENLIKPDQQWYCCGYTVFAQRRYHCARHYGHGKVDTKQAIAHSCNIPFFDIAQKISIDILAGYANKFGLGYPTGIFMDEKAGLIPNNKWKLMTKNEKWWPGETLSAAIGQSYLLVTPLQIIRMLGGIITGKLVKPRLLLDEPIVQEHVNIKESTRQFLLDSMRSAVALGTGKRMSKIKDITVLAKTGTAQTSALEKRNNGKQFKEHTWFIASIEYKDRKPLLMTIIFEHCGDNKEVLSVAKKFLLRYRSYCNENFD